MADRRDDQKTGTRAEICLEEYLLRRAAIDRAECEERVAEAVSEAISHGTSWQRIGQVLGMPVGLARQRYGQMPYAS